MDKWSPHWGLREEEAQMSFWLPKQPRSSLVNMASHLLYDGECHSRWLETAKFQFPLLLILDFHTYKHKTVSNLLSKASILLQMVIFRETERDSHQVIWRFMAIRSLNRNSHYRLMLIRRNLFGFITQDLSPQLLCPFPKHFYQNRQPILPFQWTRWHTERMPLQQRQLSNLQEDETQRIVSQA